MTIANPRNYPVVDACPTLTRAVGNFNLTDYSKIFAFSGAGYVFGWLTARKPMRGVQSKFLFGIGLAAGLTYASLSSMQRFMGLEANHNEVQRYGALSAMELKVKEDQMGLANGILIDNDSD